MHRRPLLTRVRWRGAAVAAGIIFCALSTGSANCGGSIDPAGLGEKDATIRQLASASGLVLEYSTNLPIYGAEVRMAGRVTATDASGQFVINDVDAGTQTIHLDAVGYEPLTTAVDLLVGGNVIGPFLLIRTGGPRDAGAGDGQRADSGTADADLLDAPIRDAVLRDAANG